MQAAGFKFISIKPQAAGENVPHNCNFFLRRISSHGVEHDFFMGRDCPCRYSQTELDVSFEFTSVESAVKKSEFYSALGKVAVKIDSVIAGAVIVLMVDTAAISVVCTAVPDFFCFFPGEFLVSFHGLEQIGVELLAPVSFPVSNFKSLIDQVLPGCHKIDQSAK